MGQAPALTPNGDSAGVAYTPEPGYSGPDSFVILVCDDACDELSVM